MNTHFLLENACYIEYNCGMTNMHLRRLERAALINWAANDNYTHAITLNTDRNLLCTRLNDIFSTFCHRFDKRVHRIRNMRLFPIDLRLRAIVFPENLDTNAHLHGFADFTPALKVLGHEKDLHEMVRTTWLRTTHGAGSIDIQSSPDKGWGRYITKRFDGTYFLSADYFPN